MYRPAVLLAEDDVQVARGLGRALDAAGLRTVVVHDAREAVQAMGRGNFAAIVLDVGLPSLDGLTLLSHLRDRQVAIPVLVISGRMGNARRAMACSLDARFLKKPFPPGTFVEAVLELVSSRRGPEAKGGAAGFTPAGGAPSQKDGEEPPGSGERPVEPAAEPASSAAQAAPARSFRDALRAALGRVERPELADLPLFDRRLARACELLTSGEASAASVATLVENDPRTVASILSSANAGVFGRREQITDVRLAIARIGCREVLELVTRALIERSFDGIAEPFSSMMRSTWRRSVLAAKLAAGAAPAFGVGTNPAVHPATLLQDVGELAGYLLASRVAADFRAESDAELAAVAAETVAAVHASLGSGLLRSLGLPAPLPYVALNHHQRARDVDPLLRLTLSAHELAAAYLEGADVHATTMAAVLGSVEPLLEESARSLEAA